MKKIISFFVLCGISTFSFSQKNECSVDEMLLLEEAPKEIPKRQALMVIRGEATSILFNMKEVEVPTSVFPPRSFSKNYADVLTLNRHSGGIPSWKIIPAVLQNSNHEAGYSTLIMVWIICVAVSFCISPGVAFLSNAEFENKPFRYYCVGFLASCILGLFMSFIFQPDGLAPAECSTWMRAKMYFSIVGSIMLGGTMNILTFQKGIPTIRERLRFFKIPALSS